VPDLMTTAEVAAMLRMNEAVFRDRISKRRDFPAAYRFGKNLLWDRTDILDWIESQRVSPAARRAKRPVQRSKVTNSTGRGAQPSSQVPAAKEPAPAS